MTGAVATANPVGSDSEPAQFAVAVFPRDVKARSCSVRGIDQTAPRAGSARRGGGGGGGGGREAAATRAQRARTARWARAVRDRRDVVAAARAPVTPSPRGAFASFSGEPDDDPKTRMRSNDDAYRIVLAAIFTSDFRR